MEYANVLFATLPFLLTFFFLWLHSFHKNDNQTSNLPRNWPIIGMMPNIISNFHRLADSTVETLQESHGTFITKGPWFSNLEMLSTADPNNVQYIMSKNHHLFNRGPNFEQIFDMLGDGIFNSDNDMWKYQRKIALACFTSMRFRRFMAETLRYKIERGLIPLLEHSFLEGSVIDLQDIFQRLSGDITWMLFIGYNPNFLSCEKDHSSSIRRIKDLSHEAAEAVYLRHVLPTCIWKLLRRLRIGKEKKHRELSEVIDNFIYGFIRNKREDIMSGREENLKNGDGHGVDLFSYYMEENYGVEEHGFKSADVFLRDTFTNFMFAGQDTISVALAWFFWLIIRHPRVEAKILEELRSQNISKECNISQLNDPCMLIYLTAAIYEALRLYPPVPYNHRSSNKQEILPSGHVVKPNTMIILCAYAMGRMKWVWGDDADMFKPERWITEQGTIKREPSYKFFSFNSGPRICLGREISMIQMKAVVSAVLLHNYRFQLAEGHRVDPAPSVVLRMKDGLKVNIKKYEEL